jgi:hypothetical protein
VQEKQQRKEQELQVANAIVERVHQVIGNIIHTFELQDNCLDEEDTWKGILSATVFAVRATYLHYALSFDE